MDIFEKTQQSNIWIGIFSDLPPVFYQLYDVTNFLNCANFPRSVPTIILDYPSVVFWGNFVNEMPNFP